LAALVREVTALVEQGPQAPEAAVVVVATRVIPVDPVVLVDLELSS
jgi:hypothetical protein